MKTFKSIARLATYVRPFRVRFFLALFFAVVSIVANTFMPLTTGLAINRLVQNVSEITQKLPGAAIDYPYIVAVLIGWMTLGTINQTFNYLANSQMSVTVQKSTKSLREHINQKINRLPISYSDQHLQGEMLGYVTNDVDAISTSMQQSIIRIVTSTLGILLTVCMLFYISAPMAAIALFLIPASLIISNLVLKRSKKHFKILQDTLAKMSAHVQESYTGFSILKLYGKEHDDVLRFKEINRELGNSALKATFISSLLNPLISFLISISYTGMALFGAYFVFAGKLLIGNLQAFLQYIWLVMEPVSQITQLTSAIQSASASSDRVFAFLDQPDQIPDAPDCVSLPENISGKVSFQNVSFGYAADKPLIENLNLEIKSGQTVAIVGPTGAGKTTLINLLLRFYDVQQGKICIDGVDIQKLTRSDLRSLFGVVLQDAWLYHATISDNIRLGKLDATEYEVVDASRTANVEHYIRTLPGGYNMTLNKEASNLSLGQKQLLTIARAVISNPKILILDEATSSIDTRLESLIQKAMKRVMKGRTSFVIAHRLSTIREADLILVMQQGRIIEHGTHQSLMEDGGFYQTLYNSQFSNE